jgi:predicted nucleotidyltransferase
MGLFFTPLDLILSSASKLRLLRALHGMRSPVSGREAAGAAGVAVQPAQRALADLVAAGVVHRDDTRSQHLYTLNRENVLVQRGVVPLFRAEEARVGEVFHDLSHAVGGKAVEGLYLFGSAARGKDRVGSDFDVLAVVSAKEKVNKVHETLARTTGQMYTRYGLRLSVIVLEVTKLRTMHADGDALVSELLRDNRRITGKRVEEIVHGHTRKQKAGRSRPR